MRDFSALGIIKISDQANLIAQQLQAFVDERGGDVKIVANVRHLWEEVYKRAVTNPPGVYICFESETVRGPESTRNDQGRADRVWKVVIMRGHGFRNKIAKDDEGGGATQTDDFYSVCEDIRDRIRVIKNIAVEFPIDYRGMQPLPGVAQPNMANVFCDGYSISFATANDIGEVHEGPPQEDPEEV